MKHLEERIISMDEFETLSENRKRIFKVSYVHNMKPHIRLEKIFQKKQYVHQLLNDPNIERVKLYVGDVVVE